MIKLGNRMIGIRRNYSPIVFDLYSGETPVNLPEAIQSYGDQIAVIGLSCRFPGADTEAGYWELIRDGRVAIREFDRAELEAAGVPQSTIDAPGYVPAKGVLAGSDTFDAAFFGISPREAGLIDPQQRIFLEVAYAALENAGYGLRDADQRVGIFAGSAFPTFLPWLLRRAPDLADGDAMLSAMLGSGGDYLTMRAAYKLDLTGPAVTVQTACSSSLAAVHLAVQSLLAGDCDIALAGGVTVRSPQVGGHLYRQGGALSQTAQCRPFDAEATGLVNGCGAGLIVLRRLDDAVAAGDTIRAAILGTAINNDGAQKQAFSAPNPAAQERVIRDALDVAGVSGADIDYVEAHGTGTRLGDAIETAALSGALGARDRPCLLGSVKANIGHLDAAAGIAGLIKTILAMEQRLVPQQACFENPNPECRFDASPLAIPAATQPWPQSGKLPLAGVSSFGFGGTNAHVVIAGAELPIPARDDSAAEELLVLQARSPEALRALAGGLADHISQRPELSLADIAATLRMGRAPQECRFAVVAANKAAACEALLRAQCGEPAVAGPGVIDLTGLEATAEVLEWLADSAFAGEIARKWFEQIRLHSDTDVLDAATTPAAARLQRFAVAAVIGETCLQRGLAFDRFVIEQSLAPVALYLAGDKSPREAIVQFLAASDGPAAEAVVTVTRGGSLMAEGASDTARQSAQDAAILRFAAVVAESGEHLSDALFLRCFGQAWAQGIACNWTAFQNGRPFRRVPLPSYPFARTVVPDPLTGLLHEAPDGTAVQGVSAASAPDSAPGLWRAVWQEMASVPASSAGNQFLLIYEDCPLARPLANALARFGKVTQLSVNDIDSGLSGPPPADCHAIYLCAPSDDSRASAAANSLLKGHKVALALGQSVARLDCVGAGIHPVLGADSACAGGAALHALLNVMRMEGRAAPGRTIDADPWAAPRGTIVEAARQAAAVIADLSGPELVALRGRKRFTRTFAPHVRADAAVFVRPGGSYVLIGGGGGLGRHLARRLAALPDVRLAILGRSIGDVDTDALAADIGIARDRLVTITLDVAQASSVERALADVMREFGALDGIFHLAGDAGAGVFAELGRADLAASLDAKTRGMEALLAALPVIDVDESPRFLAIVTSLTGTLGFPGQSLYAAANAAAEAIAATGGGGDVRVVSIGLDRIENVGLADPARGAQLVVPMAEDHGWIAQEHRSAGQGYLPGSAILDLMFAAGSRQASGQPVVLENVALLRPVPIDDAGALRLWISVSDPQADGTSRAELFSDRDGGTKPLARGRLRPWTASDESWTIDFDFVLLQQRCSNPAALAPDIAGVELGPRWQAPTEVQAGDGEWIIRTSLAEAAREDRFPGPVHPALLDVALSAALGAAGCAGFIPAGYARLAVLPVYQDGSKVPSALVSHVRLRTLSTSSALFDVVVADQDGHPVLLVEGYELLSVTLPGQIAESGKARLRLEALAAPLDGEAAAEVICSAIESTPEGHVWALRGDLVRAAAAAKQAQAVLPGTTSPAGEGSVTETIAAAMAKVLGEPVIAEDDDFFALGGDSILALELVGGLNQTAGWDHSLTPRDLYEASTPASLATLVTSAAQRDASTQSGEFRADTAEAIIDLNDPELADAIGRFNLANADRQ